MTENEAINGWTFEETIKTAENLIEAETNIFKWDVLRHLRDFVESFKEELKQYRELGTIEEFKALKEKSVAKKPIRKPNLDWTNEEVTCPSCNRNVSKYRNKYCDCGQKLNWSEE